MNLQLSEAAKDALTADGPILVLGGPGSGKTTLSLLKAQRLIPTLQPGQQVLFLSFSRAAVRQVLVRCRSILPAADRRLICVKTYHAFCMDILKAHGQLLTGKRPRILFPGPERLTNSAFEGDWTVERNRLAAKEGLYVFDLFASKSAELLARSLCVRELLSEQYPVIILDEFQDTDDAQWELVKLLSEGSLLITLADPDQRIFEYDAKVNPQRLNQLRAFLHPKEFDLGGDNHRSPGAGILSFADAVLHNRALPATKDVKVVELYGNAFKPAVHAYVVWMLGALRKANIAAPSVAILCRANALVADMSDVLSEAHVYTGTTFEPVDHHVVWDAELTAAAAQVVASVLEWPQGDIRVVLADTMTAAARYYDLKNTERPSKSAKDDAASYRTAAKDIEDGRTPRTQAAKQLVEPFNTGIELNGDTVADWRRARAIIASIPKLKEVVTNARYVRLLRARDEVGGRLAREWGESGTYGHAAEIVRRALDARQVISSQADPGGVLLMTIHKSKGKEFDAVILIEGQYVGKFFDDQREVEPFEASRRLLRVGITRARHKVAILRPMGATPLTNPRP